jgi:hypothetical protein
LNGVIISFGVISHRDGVIIPSELELILGMGIISLRDRKKLKGK